MHTNVPYQTCVMSDSMGCLLQCLTREVCNSDLSIAGLQADVCIFFCQQWCNLYSSGTQDCWVWRFQTGLRSRCSGCSHLLISNSELGTSTWQRLTSTSRMYLVVPDEQVPALPTSQHLYPVYPYIVLVFVCNVMCPLLVQYILWVQRIGLFLPKTTSEYWWEERSKVVMTLKLQCFKTTVLWKAPMSSRKRDKKVKKEHQRVADTLITLKNLSSRLRTFLVCSLFFQSLFLLLLPTFSNFHPLNSPLPLSTFGLPTVKRTRGSLFQKYKLKPNHWHRSMLMAITRVDH